MLRPISIKGILAGDDPVEDVLVAVLDEEVLDVKIHVACECRSTSGHDVLQSARGSCREGATLPPA